MELEKIMKVTVCIGSACHIKGSRQVADEIRRLIEEHDIRDKVELTGSFCLGKCEKDVCVSVDDTLFSVSPSDVETFFETEIRKKLGSETV